MNILGIELQRTGRVGPAGAMILALLCIGVASFALTLAGLGMQETQLALALCAGWVLPSLYGASWKQHGLKRLALSAIVAAALYFASTPISTLLVIMLG